MSNKTRKRFLPVALVMAVAAIGVVALFAALSVGSPQAVEAHGSSGGANDCDNAVTRYIHDSLYPNDPCPPQNNAPAAGAAIGGLSIAADGTGSAQSTITDADAGDTLTWTVSSSDEAVATAVVSNTGMVTVTGVAGGTATITVMASDGTASDSQTFMVTVEARPSAPPTAPDTATELDVQLTYGMGTVTVSWEAVTGATEYLVQYRQCTADACAGPLTSMRTTMTSHTITSLDTNQPHQVFVTASGADNEIVSQSDPDMVCPAAPPTELKVEPLDNAVRLSWKDPVDPFHMIEVKGFQIERVTYLQDSSNPILVNNRVATIDLDKVNQHWDLGLSYGVTYTYRVRAEVEITDGAGNRMMGYSLWNSDPQTAIVADSGGRLTPLEKAPSAVLGLITEPRCADQITVSWAAPEDMGIVAARRDANGVYVGPDFIGGEGAGKVEQGKKATSVTYQVQRMVNNGPWTSVAPVGMTYPDNQVAYPATENDPPNVYKYRVRAKNEANLYGPWTMVERKLVQPEGVNAPHNLRATLDEKGEVTLQWTAPVGGNQSWFTGDMTDATVGNGDLSKRLSYRIERVDAANMDTDFGMHDQYHQYGPRSFDDPRIRHEQDYTDTEPYDGQATYVVTAFVDGCLPSEGNSVNLDTQVGNPGAPGNVSAAASQNTITVTWTAPADPGSLGDRDATITGYNIERSSMPGSGFTSVASGHAGTSYTDSDLAYNTTYYYRVSAVNSFGVTSVMSAEASATTTVPPPPPVLGTPAITTVSSDAAGSATIMLTPGANADWQIVWAEPSDGSMGMYSDWVSGDATSVTMTGLTSGMSYWFSAVAYGSGEFSVYSGWSALTSIQ